MKLWLLCLLALCLLACDNAFVFEDAQGAADTEAPTDTSDPALPTDPGSDNDTDTGMVAPGMLFATGFENGLPGDVSDAPLVSLEYTIVHSGEVALGARVNRNQPSAAFRADFSPVIGGSLYYRAWYYIEDPPDTRTLNLLEVVDDNGINVLDVNLAGDLGFELYFFDELQTEYSVPGRIGVGEWFCLQLRVDVSDAAGGAQLFVNEAEVITSPTTMDTLPPGGISGVRAGIVFTFEEAGDVSLYLDDVAVAIAPLDC